MRPDFSANSTNSCPCIASRQSGFSTKTSLPANNARLASALDEHGIFACVAHPQRNLHAPAWAQAPFCVLQLRDKRPANYRGLADHIMEEARRHRVKIDQGGSFGFRGTASM
jgi:hypothetical protein